MTLPASEVIALYQSAGRPTCAEAGALLGVSPETVRKLLLREGVQRRAQGPDRRTPEDRAAWYGAIAETYSTGLSAAATAILHSVDRKTVWRALRMWKLPHRARPPLTDANYNRKIRRLLSDHAPLKVETYGQIVATLRARRHELGLSQLEADDLAGFQTGYTGKLELIHDLHHGRRGGFKTIAKWAGALGYDLALVEREAPPPCRREGA